MELSALEAKTVTVIRGGRLVFRDLNLSVESGKVLSVEGSNGSGKTSLLRVIAGFLAPAAGTIRLRTDSGEVSDPEERGNFIGWLGHHDAVKPQLTVRETLRFFAQLYRGEGNIDEAIQAVGLSRLTELPGQYLSAGQKKRVALARLLVCRRPLWLLDEPLASLDAAGKKIAAAIITAHCAAGGIAVVATHEALGIDCERLSL